MSDLREPWREENQPEYCPECGGLIVDEFCSDCGAEQIDRELSDYEWLYEE